MDTEITGLTTPMTNFFTTPSTLSTRIAGQQFLTDALTLVGADEVSNNCYGVFNTGLCDNSATIRRNEVFIQNKQTELDDLQLLWDKTKIIEDFFSTNELAIDGWKDLGVSGGIVSMALDMESWCVGPGETLDFQLHF